MSQSPPLTAAQKEQIYQAKLQGSSLPTIAAALGCTVSTVRKWWRRARDHGRAAWHVPPAARPAPGPLAHFDPRIAQQALALKATHPRWGSRRIRIELAAYPPLAGLALPSHDRLAILFRQQCPDLVRPLLPHPPPVLHTRPSPATAVHEVWQLDMQEGVHLGNQHVATLCTIRDPFSAALIGSQAFDVTTPHRWRKLTFAELRAVLRLGFTEWQTLPAAVQTDNELIVSGYPTDPFPSLLTLWLTGLGIAHRFSRPHRPTDQAQIERSHRILSEWTTQVPPVADVAALQTALDHERQIYNTAFPARASDCAGKAPLQAHPALSQPWRQYRPEWELVLFDLARVYSYLAQLELVRKVNSCGRVSVESQYYQLGRRYSGQYVRVRCDAAARQWVFSTREGAEVVRWAVKKLEVEALTGLPAALGGVVQPQQLPLPGWPAVSEEPPIQLSLPGLAA
jgi:transposase InsO family protein